MRWLRQAWAVAAGLGMLTATSAAIQIVEPDLGAGYRFSGTLTAPREALTKGEARLVFDYHDPQNTYYLKLTSDRAEFHRVLNGQDEAIGTAGPVYRGSAAALPFSLQRVAWGMTFFCNQVAAARAEDRSLEPGSVGYDLRGDGLAVTGAQVQPTEDIYFADDFMRADEQFGGWAPLFGQWANNQQGSKSSRSANAFSFRSGSESPALAAAGYPFWTDYCVQAAVRCDGHGAVGLAVGVVDEQHYLRLRWTSRRQADGGTCRLQRVFRGKVTDLGPAIPGGFRDKVWYKLQVALSGGKLLAWIDDTPLFEVTEPALGEGRVGLWSEPGPGDAEETGGALFDDVIVRSWPYFADDFLVSSSHRWVPRGDAWQLGTGEDGVAAAPTTGWLLAGADDWSQVDWQARAQATSGALGLLLNASLDGNGYGLRAAVEKLELVRYDHGSPTVLSHTTPGLPAGQPHRLAMSLNDGLLRVKVDGVYRLEAFDLSYTHGRCGLLAESSQGAWFDQVRGRFAPSFYRLPPALPAEFEIDPYMTDWASPGAAWVKVPDSDARWHKGFFYGDRTVKFEVPGVGSQTGKVQIILGASSTTAPDAWRLEMVLAKDDPKLTLRLLRGDQLLAEAMPKNPSEQPKVVFELRGRYLLVWVDGTAVLTYAVPEEPA